MDGLQIICPYCQLCVHSSNIVSHISIHLCHLKDSTGYCKLCSKAVSLDSTEAVIEHMMESHVRDRRCPFCEKLIQSVDHLYYHIKANTNIVYHCKSLDCLFITADKVKLRQHLSEMKHKLRNVSKEYNVSCALKDMMTSVEDEEEKLFSNSCFFKRKTVYNLRDKENVDNLADERKKEMIEYLDDDVMEVETIEKNKIIDKTCEFERTFKMEYSKVVLRKLLKNNDEEYFESILSKLENIGSYLIGVRTVDGAKVKACTTCGYSSPYGSVIIRKHILSHHCKFSNLQSKLIIKACKINCRRQLLSDQEMISVINQERMLSNVKELLSDVDESLKNRENDIQEKENISILDELNSKKVSPNFVLGPSSYKGKKRKLICIQVEGNDENITTGNQYEGEKSKMKKLNNDDDLESSSSSLCSKDKGKGTQVLNQSNVEEVEKCYKMEYSKVVLKKCFEYENVQLYDETVAKLDNLRSFFVGVKESENSKVYKCMACGQTSIYCRDHIRRHILSKHCKLTTFQCKLVSMSYKINSDWQLLSDRKMINNIKRKRSAKNINETMSELEYSTDDQIIKEEKRELKKATFIDEVTPNKVESESFKRKNQILSLKENKKRFKGANVDYREMKEIFKMDFSEVIMRQMFKKKPQLEFEEIMMKLSNVRSFKVGVVLVKEGKYYVCFDCKYSSKYSHKDIKRHILTIHCKLSIQQTKLFMLASLYDKKFCLYSNRDMFDFINRNRMENDEELLSDFETEVVEDDNIRVKVFDCKDTTVYRKGKKSTRPLVIEIYQPVNEIERSHKNKMMWNNSNGTQIDECSIKKTFSIDYSKVVLKKVFKTECLQEFEDVMLKLENIKSFSLGLAIIDDHKYFVCMKCDFSSSLFNDARRHILGKHCGLSFLNIRHVLSASKYGNDYELLSDQCIINMINQENSKNGEMILLDIDDEDNAEVELKKNSNKSNFIGGVKEQFENINNVVDKVKPSVKTQHGVVNQIFQLYYSEIILKKCFTNERHLENVLSKLKKLSSCPVGVLEMDGVKSYVCMKCKYSSLAFHEDIIQHVLEEHCELIYSQINLVMSAFMCNGIFKLYSDSEIIEVINTDRKLKKEGSIISDVETVKESNEENKTPPLIKEEINVESSGALDNSKIQEIIKIDYSERVLNKCLKFIVEKDRYDLELKLKDYKMYSVGIVDRGTSKDFVCMTCFQSSAYYISDIWKHILGKHCKIASKYYSAIVKSSKCGNGYEILSDKVLIKSVNSNRRSKNRSDLLSDSEDDVL